MIIPTHVPQCVRVRKRKRRAVRPRRMQLVQVHHGDRCEARVAGHPYERGGAQRSKVVSLVQRVRGGWGCTVGRSIGNVRLGALKVAPGRSTGLGKESHLRAVAEVVRRRGRIDHDVARGRRLRGAILRRRDLGASMRLDERPSPVQLDAHQTDMDHWKLPAGRDRSIELSRPRYRTIIS